VGENESISHVMFQQYSVLSWLLSVYMCSLWLFVLVISSYANFYVVTFCPICFVKMQILTVTFCPVTFRPWLFVLWLSVLHSKYFVKAITYCCEWCKTNTLPVVVISLLSLHFTYPSEFGISVWRGWIIVFGSHLHLIEN
jgi:hypothetical protein